MKNLSRQDSRLGLMDEKTSTVTCLNIFLFNCLACLGKTRGHVTHKSCTYGFGFLAVQQFRWLIMFNKKKELVETQLSYHGRCGGSQWLSACKHAVWLTKSGVRHFLPFPKPPPFCWRHIFVDLRSWMIFLTHMDCRGHYMTPTQKRQCHYERAILQIYHTLAACLIPQKWVPFKSI